MSKKSSVDFQKYYPLIFTIIFIIILFQYSFSSFESIFYDLRIKYDIGASFKDNVVIVTLDEESDQFLGEAFPYTYTSHSRLISRLKVDKPKMVSYFIGLPNPDSAEANKELESFKDEVKDYLNSGGEFRFASAMDSWSEQAPPDQLIEFGYNPAIINQDNSTFSKDDVTRRLVLNISAVESIHLWIANRYRELSGQEPLGASSIKGAYYLREADANFSIFRYTTSPVENKGRIKVIPFHRVVVGSYPKGFFTDKIVLVGSKYISNPSDFALTPFSKEEYRSPAIKLHAIMIQALIDNYMVKQIPRSVTYALSVLLAIILSLVISKVNPSRGLLITLFMMISIFIIGYILFITMGYWLYITHLILTVFVVYYIWVPFRAIGEYQYRYAIQEETKLLKKVENLKQNFISLMSHDLKTPVAKIAGLADNLMQRHRENEDLQRSLRSIIDSTKELNNFITSILDLTKVESRKLSINTVSRDVNKVIDQIVKDLRYEANNKEITVTTDLGPLYPIQIDVKLMTRVISNLVENAIKYAGEGTTVAVKTWDDENWVFIEIKDNGVGIPETEVEHIFEKFYRVKNDASHSIKGSGLGLYLVKYFVELHGGMIKAQSSLGVGTTFTIQLKNE